MSMHRLLALPVLLALLCSTAMATEFVMGTVNATTPVGKGCPLADNASNVNDVFDNKLACGTTDVDDSTSTRLGKITAAVAAAKDVLKAFDFGTTEQSITAAVGACTAIVKDKTPAPTVATAHFALHVATSPTTVAQKGMPCVYEPKRGAAILAKSLGADGAESSTNLERPMVGAINIPLRSANSTNLNANVLTAVLAALNIKVDCTSDANSYKVTLGTKASISCVNAGSSDAATVDQTEGYTASTPIKLKCPKKEVLCVTPDSAEVPPATGSDATGSNATGSNATGSNATGSNATGSNATGSNATGNAAFPAAISSMYGLVSAAAMALGAFAAML